MLIMLPLKIVIYFMYHILHMDFTSIPIYEVGKTLEMKVGMQHKWTESD